MRLPFRRLVRASGTTRRGTFLSKLDKLDSTPGNCLAPCAICDDSATPRHSGSLSKLTPVRLRCQCTACGANEYQLLRVSRPAQLPGTLQSAAECQETRRSGLRGSGEFAWCADDAAQLEQQPRQQSGNLHLADAEFVGDVGLRALLEVTQPDQLAFGLFELC